MKESSSSRSDGNRTGATIFAALAALMIYIIWLQLSGRPMPEWLLWATTIL